MDRHEIEQRLIAMLDAIADDMPQKMLMRNGLRLEIGPDTEPGPVDWGYQPVPIEDDERAAIREILDGDPVAIIGLRNSLRAHLLWGLWHWGTDTALLRGLVAEVWQHDHLEMLSAFPLRSSWYEPTLRQLLKAADFPVDHLPDQVKIYRGVAATDPEIPGCSGISWTLRRDLACWFAMHLPGLGGSSMVRVPPGWTSYLLTATVRRDRIAAHLTGRNEDEVIVFGMSARTVNMTSDLDDILAGEAREMARRRARRVSAIPGQPSSTAL